MNVEGHEVKQEHIDAAIERMKTGSFTFFDIQSTLRKAGLHEDACYRGADRLIQRERKAKNIAFKNKVWTPCL